MAQKPEVRFDKLFQKLYNVKLWLMAYESIAPKPGNHSWHDWSTELLRYP
jgi:hypothetical protein